LTGTLRRLSRPRLEKKQKAAVTLVVKSWARRPFTEKKGCCPETTGKNPSHRKKKEKAKRCKGLYGEKKSEGVRQPFTGQGRVQRPPRYNMAGGQKPKGGGEGNTGGNGKDNGELDRANTTFAMGGGGVNQLCQIVVRTGKSKGGWKARPRQREIPLISEPGTNKRARKKKKQNSFVCGPGHFWGTRSPTNKMGRKTEGSGHWRGGAWGKFLKKSRKTKLSQGKTWKQWSRCRTTQSR